MVKQEVIEFRQSDLGTAELCLEALRRNYADPQPEKLSTDLVRGNVVHAAIEALGQDMIDGKRPTIDRMFNAAQLSQDWYFPRVHEDGWRDTQEKTELIIMNNIEAFFEDVLPELSVPDAVEKPFRHLLYETETEAVYLKGTRDWDDPILGAVDWKNPGRKPAAWELQRGDIQSTVYLWAMAQEDGDLDKTREFHRVHLINGDVDWVTIRRGPKDYAALTEKVHAMVQLHKAKLPVWPMTWKGWYCSPKWCDHWDNCRGLHLGDEPWPAST